MDKIKKTFFISGILVLLFFFVIGSVSAVQDDLCDTSNPEGYGCMRFEWICWDAPFINIFIDTTCYSSNLNPYKFPYPDSDCEDLEPFWCYNDKGVATHLARIYVDCADCDVIKGCCYNITKPYNHLILIGILTEEECYENDIYDEYYWDKDCMRGYNDFWPLVARAVSRSGEPAVSPASGRSMGPFIDALPQISVIVIAALACLFVYVMTAGKFIKRRTKKKGKRKK
ncbi:MAG: hypothetical protein ABIF08_02945 [Nanoarchaeota archaeon]